VLHYIVMCNEKDTTIQLELTGWKRQARVVLSAFFCLRQVADSVLHTHNKPSVLQVASRELQLDQSTPME